MQLILSARETAGQHTLCRNLKFKNMKTRIFITGIALSVSALFFSQQKPLLEQQMKDYTSRIETIVAAEKSKMNAELDEVDRAFKAGKITETEKENQRAQIAARYESAINEKVHSEREALEEITRKTVKNAVMENDNRYEVMADANHKSVITVKTGEEKTHPKDMLNNTGLVVSIGFLNLTDSGAPFNFFNNSSEIRFGQSGSYNYSLKSEQQIGKYTSPVFVHYGLGIRADSHDLGPARVFAQQDNSLFIKPFTSGDIRRSQLKVEYLEVPLDVRFVLNPKYIEYEGQKYLDGSKKQFSVGVGLYGDLRISNRIRYIYSDDVSSRNQFRQKAEDGLSKFIFGSKLSVGYGGLNLFLKKDFTPIFDSNAKMNNKHGLQIGIELASVNF